MPSSNGAERHPVPIAASDILDAGILGVCHAVGSDGIVHEADQGPRAWRISGSLGASSMNSQLGIC